MMKGFCTRIHYETLAYLSSTLVDDTRILPLIPYENDNDVETVFQDTIQLDKYPLHQRLFHLAVFMRWYYNRWGYCHTRWKQLYISQLQPHCLVLPLVWLCVKVYIYRWWSKWCHR